MTANPNTIAPVPFQLGTQSAWKGGTVAGGITEVASFGEVVPAPLNLTAPQKGQRAKKLSAT